VALFAVTGDADTPTNKDFPEVHGRIDAWLDEILATDPARPYNE